MTNTYRGWHIGPAYHGWEASSPNFDASYEGPEDGWVSNGQSAWGRTRQECEDAVDEWLESQLPQHVGQIRLRHVGMVVLSFLPVIVALVLGIVAFPLP